MKTCFVISPIGDEGSETRKRSDSVMKYIITPTVKEFDYEPTRADYITDPGIIASQVIRHIINYDLVIADLTDRNPNVFYELAIRHMSRKPLIQIIRKGDALPFDVAQTRIIAFDLHELDSVEQTKKDIMAQLLAIKNAKTEFENPISVAMDLHALRSSNKPEERNMADIVEWVADIKNSISTVANKLNYPDGILPRNYIDDFVRRILSAKNNSDGYRLYEKIASDFSEIRESLQSKLAMEHAKREITLTVQRDVIQKLENIQYKFKDFLLLGGPYV